MAQLIKKADARIQQDVLDELKWDTRGKETDVGVEVDHGIVRGTLGVRRVDNQLRVHQPA